MGIHALYRRSYLLYQSSNYSSHESIDLELKEERGKICCVLPQTLLQHYSVKEEHHAIPSALHSAQTSPPPPGSLPPNQYTRIHN